MDAILGTGVDCHDCQEQVANVRRIFHEARRRGLRPLCFSDVRSLLLHCTVQGEEPLSDNEVRTLFHAIDTSRKGVIEANELLDFLFEPCEIACAPARVASHGRVSPLAVEALSVVEGVAPSLWLQDGSLTDVVCRLRQEMDAVGSARKVICIIGGTTLKCPDTKDLIHHTVRELQIVLPMSRVCFVTGGMPGTQQTFAASFGADATTAALWHLVLPGHQSGFGVGQDLPAGTCTDEGKQEIIGCIGDVYLAFEGGPGTAREARFASARGVPVIPLARTGGASSGMFDFPVVEKPRAVKDSEMWELLSRREAPLLHSARAAAQLASLAVT